VPILYKCVALNSPYCSFAQYPCGLIICGFPQRHKPAGDGDTGTIQRYCPPTWKTTAPPPPRKSAITNKRRLGRAEPTCSTHGQPPRPGEVSSAASAVMAFPPGHRPPRGRLGHPGQHTLRAHRQYTNILGVWTLSRSITKPNRVVAIVVPSSSAAWAVFHECFWPRPPRYSNFPEYHDAQTVRP